MTEDPGQGARRCGFCGAGAGPDALYCRACGRALGFFPIVAPYAYAQALEYRRRTRIVAAAVAVAAVACIAAALALVAVISGHPASAAPTASSTPSRAYAGRFGPTGWLATGRWGGSATLLPGGRVLLAGGSEDVSAEVYDPATDAFTTTGSLSTPRTWHTATLLPNGRVLIVGGAGGAGYLASAELFDPATGTFAATGSMAAGRFHHTATLLPNGRVLVAGGIGYAGYLASAELYDPATGKFTATGSMAGRRAWHTATLVSNGRVLIAGGSAESDGQTVLASAELYDPGTGTFTATGSMSVGRAQHTATLLTDGRVLIAGGYVFADGLRQLARSAELYDPGTGTFTATGSMSVGRAQHTATLLTDGHVLIAGGVDGSPDEMGIEGARSSAEVYDPAAGVFAATGSMARARYWDTATLLGDGRVLVTGGTDGTSNTDAVPTALESSELFS